jgi:hypothetical protein
MPYEVALAARFAEMSLRRAPENDELREEDGSIDTTAFEHRDGRIVAIYVTRNPEKLNHVRF